MKTFTISFSLLLISICSSFAQIAKIKSTIRKFYESNDTARSSSPLFVPDFAVSPERGVELGLMLVNHFYIDQQDLQNYGSSYLVGLAYSTKQMFRGGGRWNLWTKGNQYHFSGEGWYIYFPFSFYGIGAHTKQQDGDLVFQRRTKLNLEAEKKLAPFVYSGINLSFEHNQFTPDVSTGVFSSGNTLPYPVYGKDGGSVLFIGLNQVLDNRNSSIYTTEGSYLKFSYSYAPAIFKNNAYEGSQALVNLRNFSPLNAQTVLALNVQYQTFQGNYLPFFLMPALGDKLFRGYYWGRYRDRNLAVVQSEIRYRPAKRIGIVGIAGLGTVFDQDLKWSDIKPNLGVGLRYFFDLEKNLALRLDYVVGEKKNGEDRQQGFYIGVGETF